MNGEIDISNFGPVFDDQELDQIPAQCSFFRWDSDVAPECSVVLMTRNHSAYFRQAFSSIEGQRCSFGIEIVVAEDGSTDDTGEIVESCAASSRRPVCVISSLRPVGILQNFLRAARRTRGKYLALLEGDDYWCDERKLQLQVELLRSDPNTSWVGARTRNRARFRSEGGVLDAEAVLSGFPIHTSAIVFRRSALFPCPKFPNEPGWISYLTVLFQSRGACRVLDREVSFYRHHPGGVWMGRSVGERMHIVSRFTESVLPCLRYGDQGLLLKRELGILSADIPAVRGVGFLRRILDVYGVIRSSRDRWRRFGFSRSIRAELRVWLMLVRSEFARLRMSVGLGARVRRVLNGLGQ